MRWTVAALLLGLFVGSGALADTIPQPARPRTAAHVPVTRPETPKKRFPDQAWGLFGVAIGFLLGEGSRLWRHHWRIRRLKAALRDECRSLRSQVPMFIDICEQMVESLQDHRILPGPAVRAIRTFYDATIAELAPHLTLLERNLLHIVHEKMKVGDDVIDGHQADVLEALKDEKIADPWGSSITRVQELIGNYQEVQRLLTGFLERKPEDVFYVQRTDDEPPVFERRGSSAAVVPRTFEVARHFMRIVQQARKALHGIDAKIGNTSAFEAVGPRALRPDLQGLHRAIEEFKTTEGRVVELRQPSLEKKLSDAFRDVERAYTQADREVAPYERPDVAPGAPAHQFRPLAESARSHVARLDAVAKELEKLTR